MVLGSGAVVVTSDWDVPDDGHEDETESSDQWLENDNHDCHACMCNKCFAAVQAVPGRSHRVRVG